MTPPTAASPASTSCSPPGVTVRVSGVAQRKFTDGSDSCVQILPAAPNQDILIDPGVEVTSQIVVHP